MSSPFRYRVNESHGARGSTGHGGASVYADAREIARELSIREPNRDKAFRIFGLDMEIVGVALNGKITNRDGTGPDVDPDAKH